MARAQSQTRTGSSLKHTQTLAHEYAQSPTETAAAPSDKSNNRGSWRASQSFFGMCPPAFSTSWILRFILPTTFWTKRRGNDIAVCFRRRRVDKSTQKGRWKIKWAAASEGKKKCNNSKTTCVMQRPDRGARAQSLGTFLLNIRISMLRRIAFAN